MGGPSPPGCESPSDRAGGEPTGAAPERVAIEPPGGAVVERAVERGVPPERLFGVRFHSEVGGA